MDKLYNPLPENYEPYKTPIKFMTTETYCCPASLKVDLYQGCSFSCLYCFAMDWFLNMYHNWWRPSKPADISIVEKEFANAFSGKSDSPLSNALRHRQYIRLGSMTDSFQPIELEHRLTQKFFEIANKYDKYPVLIFTKSIIQSRDEYIKLMKDGNYVCQESISIYDDELRKKIEPGTYSTQKRFVALSKLHRHEIPVQVRISPHLYPLVDKNDTIRIIKEAQACGVNEIIWEPIRITTPSNKIFIQETGIDLIKRLKEFGDGEVESDYGGGSYRNTFPVRQKVMEWVKQEVEDRGMKFYHCLGENACNATKPGEDCCGMDNYSEFSKGAVKRNIQKIYVMLKEKGSLSYEEVSQLWTPNEKEAEKQWFDGTLIRYLADVTFDGKKYHYTKNAYLGKENKYESITKMQKEIEGSDIDDMF